MYCSSSIHNALDYFDHFLRHTQHRHVGSSTMDDLTAGQPGHLVLLC